MILAINLMVGTSPKGDGSEPMMKIAQAQIIETQRSTQTLHASNSQLWRETCRDFLIHILRHSC
jgi:hypothetical protein